MPHNAEAAAAQMHASKETLMHHKDEMMNHKDAPKFSRAAVAKHNTVGDCWIIWKNNVYNVTDFLLQHPGGDDYILQYAGKSVDGPMRDAVNHVHSKAAYDVLQDFFIGTLSDEEDQELDNDFQPEETDVAADLRKHQFLDLDKPLIPQMLFANFTKEFYLEQVHIPRHRKEPAKLMPYAFLEIFTLTPWYVIPMIWLPMAAAFFHKSVMQFPELLANAPAWLHSTPPAALSFGCYAFGVMFWTLLEYFFHRFLFHMDRLLPEAQPFYLLHFLLHGIHHFLPMDRYRLVMPPILFAALSAPMVMLAHIVFPAAVANGVIAGSYSMYVVYDTMHYALHHTKLPAYFREMKRYHLEHHYKNYELGFGVTSKIWDYVFHTML